MRRDSPRPLLGEAPKGSVNQNRNMRVHAARVYEATHGPRQNRYCGTILAVSLGLFVGHGGSFWEAHSQVIGGRLGVYV